LNCNIQVGQSRLNPHMGRSNSSTSSSRHHKSNTHPC
jgi:hypothetical protein